MDAQFEPTVALAVSHGASEYPTGAKNGTAIDRRPPNWALIPDAVAVEIGRLLDEVRTALESDFTVATKTAARLATLLAGHFPEGVACRPVRGGLAPWQRRKIRRTIEDGLRESLPVDVLAKLVDLSPSYFCRAFKETFGDPPHTYIVKMRVERARTLMLTTSEPLCQIALACGFADQAHLGRCFRQVTSMTPGKWRRYADNPQSAAAR